MLKFKTVRSTFAYLSSNLLNEVSLSLFRYFEVGLRVCDIVVKKFTFAIPSPDEFLLRYASGQRDKQTNKKQTYRHADRNTKPKSSSEAKFDAVGQMGGSPNTVGEETISQRSIAIDYPAQCKSKILTTFE